MKSAGNGLIGVGPSRALPPLTRKELTMAGEKNAEFDRRMDSLAERLNTLMADYGKIYLLMVGISGLDKRDDGTIQALKTLMDRLAKLEEGTY